ncbi:hypothetical protein EK904_011422 [Melospiza melodia maxima]|nr:hypothetical protein EK904_011422 [Melospiza melodia maxima]
MEIIITPSPSPHYKEYILDFMTPECITTLRTCEKPRKICTKLHSRSLDCALPPALPSTPNLCYLILTCNHLVQVCEVNSLLLCKSGSLAKHFCVVTPEKLKFSESFSSLVRSSHSNEQQEDLYMKLAEPLLSDRAEHLLSSTLLPCTAEELGMNANAKPLRWLRDQRLPGCGNTEAWQILKKKIHSDSDRLNENEDVGISQSSWRAEEQQLLMALLSGLLALLYLHPGLALPESLICRIVDVTADTSKYQSCGKGDLNAWGQSDASAAAEKREQQDFDKLKDIRMIFKIPFSRNHLISEIFLSSRDVELKNSLAAIPGWSLVGEVTCRVSLSVVSIGGN